MLVVLNVEPNEHPEYLGNAFDRSLNFIIHLQKNAVKVRTSTVHKTNVQINAQVVGIHSIVLYSTAEYEYSVWMNTAQEDNFKLNRTMGQWFVSSW